MWSEEELLILKCSSFGQYEELFNVEQRVIMWSHEELFPPIKWEEQSCQWRLLYLMLKFP